MLPKACVIMCAAGLSVAHAQLLDQSFMPNPVLWVVQARSDDANGQSFTVGINGLLSGVDLLIGKNAGADPNMSLDLWLRVDDPTRFRLLGTTEVDNNLIPIPGPPNFVPADMTHVDLAPLDIQVQQGQEILLMVRSPIPMSAPYGIFWFGGPPGYDGGIRWQGQGTAFSQDAGTDLGFRTYVTIPEPSSTALFSLGLLAFAAFFVHKRHAALNP